MIGGCVDICVLNLPKRFAHTTVLPEYIIQLVCDRDFNASNCTSPANIREANGYIVNMAVLNNVGALISIGPMIYFAENFGRKPVCAVVFFGVVLDQLGLGLVHTPLYMEIIHGSVGILVSVLHTRTRYTHAHTARDYLPLAVYIHLQT